MTRRTVFQVGLSALGGLLLGLAFLGGPTPSGATGPYLFEDSEGCDGIGYTDDWSPSGVIAWTNADVSGTSTDCTWVYVSGNYQDTQGQWYYGYGPGWYQRGWYGDVYTDAQAASAVGHTACNPGGSCPGTQWVWSSYPPGI